MLSFFVFNDTATTEIYTLSLHDALPIFIAAARQGARTGYVTALGDDIYGRMFLDLWKREGVDAGRVKIDGSADRKSTRLNSSHANISYAVFCLKKKQKDGIQRSEITVPP